MDVKKKLAQVEELEVRLVREIRYRRAESRLELANLLKLAPSTVGIYVDRLVATGHLREVTAIKAAGPGRPAQKLDLDGTAGCFVGVEFEAEVVHAVCVDFAGEILERHTLNISPRSRMQEVMKGIEISIDRVLGETNLKLLGIGVGVPGTVDVANGIARDYRFIRGWRDVPIVQQLQKRYKVAVQLENNARAAALGSLMFDPGLGGGDFASLLIRSGVGAGIVLNGALHRGHASLAGEIGRIRIAGSENASDTIEDLASVHAVVDFVRDRLKNGSSSFLKDTSGDPTIQAIIDAAHEGDELARAALQRAAKGLGWLAHVIALLINPQSIILISPLNALGDWLRLEVQAALNEYAETARTDRPRIVLSRFGEEVGARGAVSLAIDAWKPGRQEAMTQRKTSGAVSKSPGHLRAPKLKDDRRSTSVRVKPQEMRETTVL